MTRYSTILHAPYVDVLAIAVVPAPLAFPFSFLMSALKMPKKKREIYWNE